ncbi:conserved hypothetical protein [Desulfarculus baarsii DSM 2075]|uniref:Pancreas/duodenum homeobox protein 1 n=1 Tax=Desulfarculus baarsii (strain ATCC 33931 / DSM 2075 / LMG 7858 / VKM B-1802 / 2st14) TaxID=644282 RepID=E1QGS1_DESB2|nr:hypothetical protein [Desulfarculus baarsii]ADK84764.1 conserved hypothetical protein [Desulfarculus baarsii DSM 2075]
MKSDQFSDIFSPKAMDELLPPGLADRFFDALYGDAREGAWDVTMRYAGSGEGRLLFEFQLHQRPGKCLACNLTYGLPDVFSRHPVINVKGLVKKIDEMLAGRANCGQWQVGRTRELSRELHVIPLAIAING